VDYPDGKPLKLTLQTSNGRYLKDLELAQAIAADLKSIGVNVEVEPTEWSTYASQVANSQLTGDMFGPYGSGGEFFCQDDLADWYGGSGWAPGKWLNAEFDTMFAKLIPTIGSEKRQEMCNQLQELMYDEVPLLFLYFQVDYYGISNRLDWTPSPTERILVKWAKFTK
jgi:peptide/nickel transport system substrate-binding protein